MAYRPTTTANRAEWDRLNEQQAALYRAGRVDSPEYRAIVDRMEPLTPPGFGGRPRVDSSIASLKRAK